MGKDIDTDHIKDTVRFIIRVFLYLFFMAPYFLLSAVIFRIFDTAFSVVSAVILGVNAVALGMAAENEYQRNARHTGRNKKRGG